MSVPPRMRHSANRLSGGLEYPQYTRPEEFREMKVPDILLSGHHGEIEKWRHDQNNRWNGPATEPSGFAEKIATK